jgi:hypothetical protein
MESMPGQMIYRSESILGKAAVIYLKIEDEFEFLYAIYHSS